jgi:hypothetical protein
MMLYGMGMRKAGYKKKKIKLPAWVSKPIPKKGKRFPNVPKGFSKKAGWFWNKHKKKAQRAQAKVKSVIGSLWDRAKKVGSNVVSSAVDTLGKHANTLLDKGTQLLNDHMDEIGSAANQFIDQQADKYTKKASDKMDSYGRKKKGSGWADKIGGKAQWSSGKPRGPISRSGRTMGSLSMVGAPMSDYLSLNRRRMSQAASAAAAAMRRRGTK